MSTDFSTHRIVALAIVVFSVSIFISTDSSLAYQPDPQGSNECPQGLVPLGENGACEEEIPGVAKTASGSNGACVAKKYAPLVLPSDDVKYTSCIETFCPEAAALSQKEEDEKLDGPNAKSASFSQSVKVVKSNGKLNPQDLCLKAFFHDAKDTQADDKVDEPQRGEPDCRDAPSNNEQKGDGGVDPDPAPMRTEDEVWGGAGSSTKTTKDNYRHKQQAHLASKAAYASNALGECGQGPIQNKYKEGSPVYDCSAAMKVPSVGDVVKAAAEAVAAAANKGHRPDSYEGDIPWESKSSSNEPKNPPQTQTTAQRDNSKPTTSPSPGGSGPPAGCEDDDANSDNSKGAKDKKDKYALPDPDDPRGQDDGDGKDRNAESKGTSSNKGPVKPGSRADKPAAALQEEGQTVKETLEKTGHTKGTEVSDPTKGQEPTPPTGVIAGGPPQPETPKAKGLPPKKRKQDFKGYHWDGTIHDLDKNGKYETFKGKETLPDGTVLDGTHTDTDGDGDFEIFEGRTTYPPDDEHIDGEKYKGTLEDTDNDGTADKFTPSPPGSKTETDSPDKEDETKNPQKEEDAKSDAKKPTDQEKPADNPDGKKPVLEGTWSDTDGDGKNDTFKGKKKYTDELGDEIEEEGEWTDLDEDGNPEKFKGTRKTKTYTKHWRFATFIKKGTWTYTDKEIFIGKWTFYGSNDNKTHVSSTYEGTITHSKEGVIFDGKETTYVGITFEGRKILFFNDEGLSFAIIKVGKQTLSDGTIMEGTWVHKAGSSEETFKGTITYPDGSKKKGTWTNYDGDGKWDSYISSR